jgi:leucine efflux protein
MSWYGVTDLWTYVFGAFIIILLPGPNSLYVLSVATARGIRAGYRGACGVFLGDSILLLLTGAGAAGVLRASLALFVVLKVCGVAYLGWIGLNLLRGAWRNWNTPATAMPHAPAEGPATNLQRPFRQAMLISLLNPKAILFLLSFFVQFIDPTYATPVVPFLILSGILMTFSALYLSALIFMGARLAQAFRTRKRLSAILSSAVGGLFLWFGSKLAMASLN